MTPSRTLRPEETLAALPSLLALARQMIVSAFKPGDPEIDALRDQLEACVVDAHRLRLREQLKSLRHLANRGTDK